MVEKVTVANVGGIANPAFRDYARRYVDIEEGFREAVAGFGVPFAEPVDEGDREAAVEELASLGVRSLNDGKSLVSGWQSPACEACRLGLHAETYVMTLACPRRCFFCFNPNQADFDGRAAGPRDVVRQLEARARSGVHLRHVALTGGEPLLHPDEAVAFFERAWELFPGVHSRLYTSGAGLDGALLTRLRGAGLSEIRFSVKTDEGAVAIEEVLALIGEAVGVIPDVMVEMPVMSDELGFMKELLVRLDRMGVRGVNLLELGFPLFNGEEFVRRDLKLKGEPYRVLYDYAYAAGLPVAGSEEACLALLRFAREEGLSIGVHYCSMENKHTGQVYRQNAPYAGRYPLRLMSRRDHFLKSAKAFGVDRAPVREVLAREGVAFEDRDDLDSTEFPLDAVALLRGGLPDIELAVSYAICEPRDGEIILRELRLDRITPSTFDFARDW